MNLQGRLRDALLQVAEHLKETRFPNLDIHSITLGCETMNGTPQVRFYVEDENGGRDILSFEYDASVVVKVNAVKVESTVEEEWDIGEIRATSKTENKT